MNDKNKPQLRIHKVDSAEPVVEAPRVLGDDVAECLMNFVSATGWAVRSSARKQQVTSDGNTDAAIWRNHSTPSQEGRSHRWQMFDALPCDAYCDAEQLERTPLVSEKSARALLDSIEALVDRLEKAEQAVRSMQAHAATNVAVVRNQDENKEIADRLEAILATSCTSIKASAAAIYILDEQTSELKMRSCWNLPVDRLMAPPRALRGSLADLESLLGNAVLIEDLEAAPSWQSPEHFSSAMIVPIGSVSMPHGTIWYWSDQVRKYDPAQIEVANMAAGRVMNELEQTILGAEVKQSRATTKQLDQAATAQQSRLPNTMQALHRHFEIDGWTLQNGMLGGAFLDWEMTPKQQIVGLVGNGLQTGVQSAIVAASIQSISRTSWASTLNPSQIMQRINDYLFQGGDEDWAASASLIQIEPTSGRGMVTTAGDNQLFVISHMGFRPIGAVTAPLASTPESSFQNFRFALQPGEVLLAMSSGLVKQLNLPCALNVDHYQSSKRHANEVQNRLRRHKRALAKSLDQHEILREIREMIDEPATEIVQHFERRLPILLNQENAAGLDRSLLVIRNCQKCY